MSRPRDPRITGVDELTNPLLTLPAVTLSDAPPADTRNIVIRLLSRLYNMVVRRSANAPASVPLEQNYVALNSGAQPVARSANTRTILQDFSTRQQLRTLPTEQQSLNGQGVVSIHGENDRMFVHGHNHIIVDSRNDPSDRFKQLLMARVFNSIRPLENWEYAIVAAAFLVAMGASSTFKDFGDHFFEVIEKKFGEISNAAVQAFLEWFIGLDNLNTQSCLTATTFIHIVSLTTRGFSVPSHEYIKNLSKKEKTALSIVLVTGFSSCKMAYDTLYTRYKWPIVIGVTAGALSYISSTIINLNFFRGMIYDLKGDNNKVAAVRMLKRAKIEFQQAANNEEKPDDFIHRLANNHLAKQLNCINLLNPVAVQCENILEELAETTTPIADSNVVASTFFTRIMIISMTLGLLASFVNMKAGMQVPNFLTGGFLPIEDNPIVFFEELDEKNIWNWISMLLGLIVFGIPSLLVNTIINTRSCETLITSAITFVPELCQHGLQKYNRNERIFMVTGLVGSGGYAAGKAGSTILYALIPVEPIPEINAGISFVVFFGLGILSVKTFVLRARNRYSGKLLADALRENDVIENEVNITGLWNFYRNLSPEQQMTLRRLLLNNITTAIDSMIATLNMTVEDAEIWTDALHRKIEEKFGIKPARARMEIVLEEPTVITPPNVLVTTTPPSAPPGSPPATAARRRLTLTASPLTRAEIDRHSLYNLGMGEIFRNPGSPSPSMFSVHNRSGNNLQRLRQLEAVHMDPLNLVTDSNLSAGGSSTSSPTSPQLPSVGGHSPSRSR